MNDYYGYDGLSGGALVALILVYTILPLAIYALYSWFYMKIFEKAGVQGKWRAWVPVYSTMIFYKLGDLSPWLVLYLIGGGITLAGVILAQRLRKPLYSRKSPTTEKDIG